MKKTQTPQTEKNANKRPSGGLARDRRRAGVPLSEPGGSQGAPAPLARSGDKPRKGKCRAGKKPVLVYTESPANGGLVFATPERAEFISRIHAAIHRETWAEVRRIMPRSEYSRMIRDLFDNYGEPRPRGCDPFSPEEYVPGYYDGVYPDWLQQEMDDTLPPEVIERFGKGEMTLHDGGYTHIDPADLSAIKGLLEGFGYVVKDGSHLGYWY
jgi:hypothetical protein